MGSAISKDQLDEIYRLATTAKVLAANVKTRMNTRFARFRDNTVEEVSFLELAKGIDQLADAVRKLSV